MRKTFVALLVMVLIAGTSCSVSPTPQPTARPTVRPTAQPTAAPTVGPTQPPVVSPTLSPVPPSSTPAEVTTYAKDWPMFNRDYANTRATMDSAINSGNVTTLGVAWSFPIPGTSEWGAAATTPLILGDTVYLLDLKSNLFALDLKSGAVKWKKEYNLANYGPDGLAVGYGKVFVPKGHYEVAALDMTGKELWSTALCTGTIGIDVPLVVFDNLVYVATVPGTANVAFYTAGGFGTIYALDQATGQVVWSFDTVDSKDIWGNPKVNSGGGCWYPPAIDVAGNMTYWGIANPAPWPGTKDFPNGSSRPGPNLYTNSLLALGDKDGKLQWYNQVLPHDLFDYDLQISPILATATIEGAKRDIIIAAGKMGRVYAMDRQTGKTLWQTPVGMHQNDELKELPPGTTRVLPGPLGGVETPMAFADGVVYVPLINLFCDFTPTGGDFSTFDMTKGTGELVALDVNTGKILWDTPFHSLNVGAATVVNDLVFTATFDGTVYALKRSTGEIVWHYQAPAGINAWPAVAGDTIVWPAGLGGSPALLALRLGAAVASPALTIANPHEGTILPAGDIPVSVLVAGFNVIDKQGAAKAAGEGHMHYFLDVEPPTTPGQPAVVASGTWAHVASTSYTFTNVPPGTHTIAVELVNNDHTPLEPPVVAKVTVTVAAAPTPPPPSKQVTVIIAAKNMAFDLKTITVPAGAHVTVIFKNNDAGVPHNLAVYENQDAQKVIFRGGIITGVKEITQEFDAPAQPGTYFFRCDVHPQMMTGQFIVQ